MEGEDLDNMLEQHAKAIAGKLGRTCIPRKWRAQLKGRYRGGRLRPKRSLKRDQYAAVQNLFKKDRSACANYVLKGEWRINRVGREPTHSEMVKFWKQGFQKETGSDSRRISDMAETDWGLLLPITKDEVESTLAGLRPSAAGPDGIKVIAVKLLPPVALMKTFNLWLLSGALPGPFKKARTVLLRKLRGRKSRAIIDR